MNVPDPLVRALLPVLIHKLGNTTQLLTGLNAMLHIEGGEDLFASRVGDLGHASGQVHELGFALAALGSAAGAELLLARRDPRGVAVLVELAGAALRRAGRRLAPVEVPSLAPQALDGWQVPWAVASAVFAAGETLAEGETLDWSCASVPGGWRVALPSSADLDARLEQVLPRLPGAQIEREEALTALVLPPDWLRASTTD